MARQAVPRPSRSKRETPRRPAPVRPKFTWGGRQWEVAGVLLVALAVFTVVALFRLTPGRLSDGWAALLRQLFGWGAFVVPIGLGVVGWHVFRRGQNEESEIDWLTVVGVEVAFCGLLTTLHALALWADPWQLLNAGGGGGVVGWGLATLVANAVAPGSLGRVFTGLVFLLVTLVGVWMAFRVQMAQLAVRWSGLQLPAMGRARQLPLPEPEPVREAQVEKLREPRLKKAKPAAEVKIVTTQEKKAKAPKRDRRLPPFDLLAEENAVALEEDEIKRKAALIEETLRQFGLVGRVIEVSPGPAVTQFGLEPGYIERPGPDGTVRRQKVRVGQIASLHNDLSLALAASPLRIEAPVPGKSIVGIEVPNEGRSIVSLRGILESPSFRKLAGKSLAVALGRDVAGGAVSADLATMPHLLIAGTTGSGKSVCINAIITCMVMSNQPEDLKMVMIDPKMVELVRWNGLPHLLGKVETDLDRIVGVLRWVTREMDGRYKKFSEAGSRNLADYNEKMVERGEDKLPYLVVLVDELADLMMMAPVEVEKTICRLAQMARATGIHLVLATQRPSTDVVTGLIKANFPARISFAVASSVDSRVILDSVGAETLLGKGDMLYLASDSGHTVRLQGCFVSDREMESIVQFWKDRMEEETPEEAPWEQALATLAESGGGESNGGGSNEEDDEELLRQAIGLVKRQKGASASMLQRKMRIGYPKAARIIDQMEEMGIIGPPEAAG
ncbi:MAG: ftsK, partial [Chloroflexi bacterium]|nr:ftsK [Chloroflexota bacterium]